MPLPVATAFYFQALLVRTLTTQETKARPCKTNQNYRCVARPATPIIISGTITALGGATSPSISGLHQAAAASVTGHGLSRRGPAHPRFPAGRAAATGDGRLIVSVDQQMDPPVLSRLCGQPSAAATVRAGLAPGQFPAAGGVAPGGTSRDVDDVAGETSERARVRTMKTTEAVSSDGMEKRLKRHHWRQIAPLPEKNRGMPEKRFLPIGGAGRESQKNHKKGPRWSWARNQMENPD